MNNGIYIGSFDMFTRGHQDVLEQALMIFDRVYLVIAENPNKKRRFSVESSIRFIVECLKDEVYSNRVAILASDKPATDIAKMLNSKNLIRGIRNVTDYTYEEHLCNIYRAMDPEINIVYLKSHYDSISSSDACALLNYGKDVSNYINTNYLEVLKRIN